MCITLVNRRAWRVGRREETGTTVKDFGEGRRDGEWTRRCTDDNRGTRAEITIYTQRVVCSDPQVVFSSSIKRYRNAPPSIPVDTLCPQTTTPSDEIIHNVIISRVLIQMI